MYEGLGQVLLEQEGKRRESLDRSVQAIEALATAVAGNPRVAYFRRSLARAFDRFEAALRGLEPTAEYASFEQLRSREDLRKLLKKEAEPSAADSAKH